MADAPLRAWIETRYAEQAAELTGSEAFQAFEAGRGDCADFIGRVARTHLQSPKVLAFLYALAPVGADGDLLHNFLEESGLEDDHGDGGSHPDMLRNLVKAAGLTDRLAELEQLAWLDLRQKMADPLLYGTLRDIGLAALVEVVAFEWMLSRTSSRIARALAAHTKLGEAELGWFTHHAEVDIAHAEEGLNGILTYIDGHAMDADEARAICEMALRENLFIKRYFGEVAQAAVLGR